MSRPKAKCKTGLWPYNSRIKAMIQTGVKSKISYCKSCKGFHVSSKERTDTK